MVKKILELVLVLGMASAAQAAMSYLAVAGAQQYAPYPGQTIKVDLIANVPWEGCVIDNIVEAGVVNGDLQAYDGDVVNMGGTIGPEVIYTSAAIAILESGYQDNYMGNLACAMAADVTGAPITAGNVTISFDYTVNPSWNGTPYWIACLKEGETYYWGSGDDQKYTVGESFSDLGASGNVLIQGLHIIPEPATLALLGLGGLFLRRRRYA